MASQDHQNRDWVQVDRSNLHLNLQGSLGSANLQNNTFLPLSILCEATTQPRGVDWAHIDEANPLIFWSDPGAEPEQSNIPFQGSRFDVDPHLRWIQGRSLCCVPVWAESAAELQGVIYLEGDRRDPLSLPVQDSLCLLGQQILLGLELERQSATFAQREQRPTRSPALESESLLRLFLKHTPAAVALFDRQMCYLLVSDRWREDYNLEDQVLRGRSHYDVFPHLDDRWKTYYERALQGEVLRGAADPFPQGEGSVLQIRWELHPWYLTLDGPNDETPREIGGVILFTEILLESEKTEVYFQSLNESLKIQLQDQTQALIKANKELSIEVETNQWITDLAKRFVEVDFHHLDEEIHLALEDLGCFCQVDSAFIFQYSANCERFSMTHEWCLHIEDRCLNLAQNLPRRKSPWMTIRLLQGEIVSVPDLETLPETATLDRLYWEEFGLRSFLYMPLRIQGRPLGWLGIAQFQDPREWNATDLRLMQSLSEIFSYALHQQKAECKLREQAEQLALTVEATKIGVWEILLAPNLQIKGMKGSPYWEEMLGFSFHRFDGTLKTFLEQVHPQDQHFFEYDNPDTLKNGQGHFEYRVVTPQKIRWLSRRYRVSYDANGDPVRLLGIDEDITERKTLQEDRDRFFALSNDLLCVATLEGYLVQVNPAFERVLGYTTEELTHRPYLDFIHPDDRPRTLEAAQDLFEKGKLQNFENRYRCKDGSYRWLSWSISVLIEENLSYAVARDVTEQKEMTSALAASEALFQSMNNNLPGVIYRYELYPDGSDAITYANSGSLLIWELPPETVQQDCSLAWGQVHPDDFAAMQTSVLYSAEHLSQWVWEWRLINPSGRQIWVRVQAMPQSREDGTVVWDGIILDVSDRKLAEESLRNSEARYRRIVETTTEGIWILDENNITTFVNAQMAIMLGYSPLDLLGKNLLSFMDLEGKEIAVQALDSQLRALTQQHDFKFQRKNGSTLWAIVSAQPIFDDQGQYAGALAMVTDITERKQAEQQLRQHERIVATTSDAIAVIDRQYIYQMANQAYVKFAQKTKSEIVGHTVAEVIGQELFDRINKAKIDECFTGKRIEYDLQQEDDQGQISYKSVVYVPYIDSEGEVTGLLASIRDLTEQKRAQEALLAAQAQYQTFLDTALEGFMIVDAKEGSAGHILEANPAYCQMVGYTHVELLEMHISDLDTIENPQQIQEHIDRLRQGGSHYFETSHRCKNGETIDLAASVTYNSDRQVLYSFMRDITQQNKAQEAIRQNESNLKTIINTTTYGILILDQSGKIRFLNDAARLFFERSEAELLGSDFGIPICDNDGSMEIEILSRSKKKTLDIRVSEIQWENQPAHFVSLHDITEQKEIEESLRYQAYHDLLTGLPNRSAITERIQQILDYHNLYPNYYFALLFIDLDRFKIVNDSLGHVVGDSLLIEVANRLKKRVGQFDYVARLSGDEFVILLENISGLEEVKQIAHMIKMDFHQPLEVAGQLIVSTVSIGIAFSNHNYKNSLEILRDADNAMYRAKSRGKDRYEVFDQTMHTQALRSLTLERELRRAVEQQEFEVYYQPIICLQNNALMGAEALIRWHHPEEGMISPGEFIPLAEETGLIVPIGEWVLDQVCQQLLCWQPTLETFEHFSISVNLSSRQLQLPDLCARLDKIINRYHILPHYLKFEITETLLIDNLDYTTVVLEHLQVRNIAISIDDFGTGYSSLSYLHRLPIHTLKIDKSFVAEMQEGDEHIRYPIVEAIVNLAHSLDMSVVAEGIETLKQIQILKQMGCEFAQGYIFSRPVNQEQFSDILTEKTLKPNG
ncbi:MAG: PAS domain S-box protein [Prochlorotrichaceae cyanobacterium]